MKDLYNKPEIEVIFFENIDIITTSVTGDNDADIGDSGWPEGYPD